MILYKYLRPVRVDVLEQKMIRCRFNFVCHVNFSAPKRGNR